MGLPTHSINVLSIVFGTALFTFEILFVCVLQLPLRHARLAAFWATRRRFCCLQLHTARAAGLKMVELKAYTVVSRVRHGIDTAHVALQIRLLSAFDRFGRERPCH